MLKRIEIFLEIIKTTASGIFGILSGFYLKKYLAANADDTLWFITLFSIVLFVVLSSINWSVTKMVENNEWLRRLILGKHFVEGRWIQRIDRESLDDRPPIFSLVYISFDKNVYKISGESFDSNGLFTANFQSQFSDYSQHILKYPFTVSTLEVKDKKIFGTSKLTFSLTDEYPNRYLGLVYSNIREKPVTVIGKKIAKKIIIDLKTSEGREKLISLFR